MPLPSADVPPPAAVAPAEPARDRVLLVPSIVTGVSARLGSGQILAPTSRAGLSLGASLAISWSPVYALGVSFERGQIDREAGGVGGVSSIEASRDRTLLWGDARIRFVDLKALGLVLTLGPGLVWESVHASGYFASATGAQPSTFACSDAGSASLALRARLGVTIPVGDALSIDADGGADMLRLGSDSIGTCLPGAGTVALFVGRVGVGYAFDVTRAVR